MARPLRRRGGAGRGSSEGGERGRERGEDRARGRGRRGLPQRHVQDRARQRPRDPRLHRRQDAPLPDPHQSRRPREGRGLAVRPRPRADRLPRALNRREFLGLAVGAVLLAPPPHLRELRRGLAGDVLTPTSAGYNRARLLYSPRFDSIHPQAIVLAETAEDVAHTIRWARRHRVHLVPRSGRHSYGGYSTTTGVVLDVSRLNRVRVSGGQAVVGAGALLVDVYAALAAHGRMIPAGTCPSVGIAGLTLGGGHGYASRKLGLACDALVGLTIVTASGEVLRCDAHRHSDLFWACRGGGGGNFGVVTSFTFRTTPVGEVATYVLEWPWAQVREVVAAWQAFAPHAPEALSLDLNLTATDTRPHVTSAGQYLGSAADLKRALAPLLAVGTPSHVEIVPRTFLEAALHFAGCDREGVEQCRRADRSPHGTVQRETWKAKSDYVKRPLP